MPEMGQAAMPSPCDIATDWRNGIEFAICNNVNRCVTMDTELIERVSHSKRIFTASGHILTRSFASRNCSWGVHFTEIVAHVRCSSH